MDRESNDLVVIFQSTADALMAESCLQTSGIPGRLIPAPRHLSHGCGLAWRAPETCRSLIEASLKKAHIDGEIHQL